MAVMWHRHLEPTTVVVVEAAVVAPGGRPAAPLLRFGVGLGWVERFDPDRGIR